MRFSLRKCVLFITFVNLGIVLIHLYQIPVSTVLTISEGIRFPTVRTRNESTRVTPVFIPDVNSVRYAERHSGPCMELKRPLDVRVTDIWYKVSDGVKNYVFSAYLEDMFEPPKVRLLGLVEKGPSSGLYCQLWYNNTQELSIVPVMIKKIPEDHAKRYSANFFICPLERKYELPYAVSLVTSKCENPSNLLAIQNDKTQKWKFSLCLTPFNFRYSRAHELVEMVELNRILGVQQFFFYNYSTGVNVDRVLREYVADGIVQVIQWHLPILVDTWPQNRRQEIHYFGQLSALNECLYRNFYRSKYVVFTDLDEFIVPRKVPNLSSLMDSVDKEPAKYSGFVFRCVFFRKEWPQYKEDFKDRSLAEKYKSVTLLNVDRESNIWPVFQRSKYIVRPLTVETVGIHTVWVWRPGYSMYRVEEGDARLHHYRNWENPTDQQTRLTDLIIHERFKDRLLEQLDVMWKRLPGVELDIPITNYTFPL